MSVIRLLLFAGYMVGWPLIWLYDYVTFGAPAFNGFTIMAWVAWVIGIFIIYGLWRYDPVEHRRQIDQAKSTEEAEQ